MISKITYILLNAGGYSTAAKNRIEAISKGLKIHAIEVKLIEITNKRSYKNDLLNKTILALKYFYVSIGLLRKSKKNDAFVFYGHFPYINFLLKFKRKETKIIAERNEFPSSELIHSEPKSALIKRSLNYCKNIELFDGFISCSNELINFYSQYSKDFKYIIIPTIIDHEKFESSENQSLNRANYITYCGDWGNSKDGVSILIKAFAVLINEFPNHTLRLIGGTKNKIEESNILNLIKDLKLNDYVKIEGRVKHDVIPHMLQESKILALARPNNKQASGGFPSKITEYLATGVPTLVTNVGDIEKYFSFESIQFAEPDSYENFAEKLKYIIQNYDHAKRIAANGVKINRQFDYKAQGEKLKKFIQSI